MEGVVDVVSPDVNPVVPPVVPPAVSAIIGNKCDFIALRARNGRKDCSSTVTTIHSANGKYYCEEHFEIGPDTQKADDGKKRNRVTRVNFQKKQRVYAILAKQKEEELRLKTQATVLDKLNEAKNKAYQEVQNQRN